MSFSLPLVSVVIVNHNYGRFLFAAVESIYRQTYPHVECIIVDNASTDCSKEVIERIRAAWPQTIVLARGGNDGQSIASIEGFKSSRGQYVVFLDADDALLPDFVRTHVFVHLSTRIPVGMTSSDVMQTAGDQFVVAIGQAMNDYFRGCDGPSRGIVRSITQSLKSECFEGFDETVLDRLYFIPPGPVRWVWSPTSANFYRRDALDLIMDAKKLPALRASTDVFCCVGVNGLCGGLLIDRALSVYRIHGLNFGTRHAQLYGIQVMREGKDLTIEALDALLDHLTAHRASMLARAQNPADFHQLLMSMRQWLEALGRASVHVPLAPRPTVASKLGRVFALLSPFSVQNRSLVPNRSDDRR